MPQIRRASFLQGVGVALLLSGCGEPRALHPETAPTAPTPKAAADVVAEAPVAEGEEEDPARAPTRGTIVLVPLKSFPDDLLDEVETTLERELQVEVKRHEVEPLPKSAYYKPRKRYRADKLLDHLLTFVEDEPESTFAMGLTEVDISTTNGKIKDWGIFGLGYSPGRAAVVSSFRLKRRAKSRKHVRFRVANTALHEAGHMFGLPHCTEPACPMRDAEGKIASTDNSEGHLGPLCQAQLDAAAPL